MNKSYLVHHGIKGMRWGLRRFQYEDGSLTPAGKKRYGTKEEMYKDINKNYGSVDAVKNQGQRNRENLDKTGKVLNDSSRALKDASNIGLNSRKSKVTNNADYSKMSDDELRKRIKRIGMERTYGELTGDTKRVRSGSDWTREVLQSTGAVVGIAGTIAGIVYTVVSIKNENKKKGGG